MSDPRAGNRANASALTIEPGPSHDALAAAFQQATIGIAIGGPEGRLRDANPALLRMLGYERHELLNLPIADITHVDDHHGDAAQLARLASGEVDAYQREKRYLRKDGSVLWGLVTVSALRDETGAFLGSTAQIQDITAQKLAEAALSENEARLEALVGQLPVVLYSQPWGGKHTIRYVSPRFEQLTGLRLEDIPTNHRDHLERVHPDDRGRVQEIDAWADRTGETARAEYRYRGGNGEWVWIDHQSVLMRDAAGRPVAWHGSLIDISERKRLEALLHESDIRFRRAFEDSAIGMAIGTPDDICLDANEAYCRMVGRPREQLIGRSFKRVTYPEDHAAQDERLVQMVSGEADSFVVEKRYLRPDGSVVTGLATISAVRDDRGALLYCVGQIVDITEQQETAAALSESEEHLRSIIEQAPAAVYRFEPGTPGLFTFASPHFKTLTGLSIGDGITKTGDFFPRVHPDDLPLLLAADAEAASSGEAFDAEYRMRGEDGSWIWIHDRSSPARDAQGHIVAWHGVFFDISERKRLEAEISEKDARLQALIEHLPVALYSVEPSPAAHYSYTSPQFEQLTGLAAAELERGASALDAHIHPDDLPAVNEASWITDVTGDMHEMEYRVRSATGDWRWVHDRALLARDDAGAPYAWYGVLLDISERKRLQAALRENEERLQVLVEQLPAALFSLEPGSTTHYAYVSPQFSALTGMSAEEIARGIEALFVRMHPDDVTRVRESDRVLFETEQPHEIEYRVRRDDGDWVWLQERTMLARDAQGRPLAWHGVLLDISEQRRLEGSLRESEARFRSTFEGAGVGMALCTPDCHVQIANPALEQLLGFGPGELNGQDSDLLTHPDDLERHRDCRWRLQAGEIDSYELEKRYARKDGHYVWVILNVTGIRDERGVLLAVIGQVQDITARKAAEAALRESEERFRSAFEGAGIGMSLADLNGRFFDANPAFCDFLGYTRAELVNLSYLDITHPDDRASSEAATRQLFRQGHAGFSMEKRYVRADGRTVWGQLTITTMRDGRGKPHYEIAQVQDITARKEAEAALLESEARFRSTFEGAGIGMPLVDPDGRFLDVNPAFCHFVGYTREELLRLTSHELTHPDDREVDAALSQRMQEGEIDSYALEKRYVRADGHTVWGNLTVTAMRNPDGKLIHRIAQIQDITARKEAEAAQRESEARFESIFADAGIGMAITTPSGKIELINPALATLLGYSPEELIGTYVQDVTHPDDLDEQELFRRRTRAGEIDAYLMEKRYLGRDGEVVWGLLNVSAVRDEAGRITSLIGQVQDISARKEAEAALRESEARFRALVQNDPDVIVIVNEAMQATYVSPSAATVLGATPQAVMDAIDGTLRHVHPEDTERMIALMSEIRHQEGARGSTEVRIRHTDQGWRWFQVSIVNLLGDPGVKGYLINLRDITERKHAEIATATALKTQQAAIAELERLHRSKSRFLSTISHEFRTPLTAIIGYSEFMINNAAEPALIAEDAEVIHREASRLNRMVDDVLLLDRVDARHVSLNVKQVDLPALVQDVTETLRPLMEKHTLVLELDPDLRTIDGDRDRLAQALTNLVSNAVKYSPMGGAVTIRARNEGDGVLLSVHDEGIGIAADDLVRIFDRFERIETGIAGRISGTGLGLPIVREIANLHGGRAWVESEPGFGSTFFLALPGKPPTQIMPEQE